MSAHAGLRFDPVPECPGCGGLNDAVDCKFSPDCEWNPRKYPITHNAPARTVTRHQTHHRGNEKRMKINLKIEGTRMAPGVHYTNTDLASTHIMRLPEADLLMSGYEKRTLVMVATRYGPNLQPDWKPWPGRDFDEVVAEVTEKVRKNHRSMEVQEVEILRMVAVNPVVETVSVIEAKV